MIGSALKKLAAENGLQVAHGIAYGGLRGYTATISGDSSYTHVILLTRFSDPAAPAAMQEELNQRNLRREFSVMNVNFTASGIAIDFINALGVAKKVAAFFDYFFPILARYPSTRVNVCSECGEALAGGRWVLVDGVAMHVHDACAQRIQENVVQSKQEKKSGSYLTGTLGALLGALIGSILWAVVLGFGYVASVVGLVIGWLAGKGYDLLHGKQGKGKVAILIVAVIFGVALGTLLPDMYTVFGMIRDGELPIAVTDIPAFLIYLMRMDSEYLTGVLTNGGMGLLFAALGTYTILRQTGKDVSGTKLIDLGE